MIAEPGATDKPCANIRAKFLQTKKKALPVRTGKACDFTIEDVSPGYGFGADVAGAGLGVGADLGAAAVAAFTG